MYQKEVSAEEVLASRVVCEPLHLFMLCSPNEGAAAVVLTRDDRPEASAPAPVTLAGAVLRSHLPGAVLSESTPLSGLVDDTVPPPSTLAATAAFEEAGLGPVGPRRRGVPGHRCRPGTPVLRGTRPVPARWFGCSARIRRHRIGRIACPSIQAGGCSPRVSRSARPPSARWWSWCVSFGANAARARSTGARVALSHTVGRGANAGVVVLTR